MTLSWKPLCFFTSHKQQQLEAAAVDWRKIIKHKFIVFCSRKSALWESRSRQMEVKHFGWLLM